MIDIESPLLEDFHKDYYQLDNDYKQFLTSVDIIDKELNSIKNIQDIEKITKM